VVTEVAKSLSFSPQVQALADRILEDLTEGGTLPFNGLHLRIEKDARDWATIMGGQQVTPALSPDIECARHYLHLVPTWLMPLHEVESSQEVPWQN
jgi:hypothetical protein